MEHNKSVAEKLRRFAWVAIGIFGQVIPQIAMLTVFAKAVGPEVFGSFAVALILVDLCQLLAERGTAAAIIQKAELSSNALRVAIRGSVRHSIGYGVLLVGIGAVGGRLGWSGDLDVAIGLSAPICTLMCISKILEARLQRDFAFPTVAKIAVISAMGGYVATGFILLATTTGVYILLGASIAHWSIRAALLGIVNRRIFSDPDPAHSEEINGGFSAGILREKIWNYVIVQFDRIVIGALLGPVELGKYHVAAYLQLPGRYIGDMLDAVLFPTFSRTFGQLAAIGKAWVVAIVSLVVIFAAAALVFSEFAEFIVKNTIGEQWLSAVPAITVLAWYSGPAVASRMADIVNRSQGFSKETANRRFIVACCFVTSTAAASQFGLVYVCYAVVLTAGVNAVLQLLLAGRVMRLQHGDVTLGLLECMAPATALLLACVLSFLGVFVHLSLGLCAVAAVLSFYRLFSARIFFDVIAADTRIASRGDPGG